MREQKFRAVITERNAKIIFTLEDLIMAHLDKSLFSIREILIPWLLSGNESDRYTGLNDKNGVEIYENDIVEYRGKSGVVFMRLGCWFVEHQRELGYYNNSVEIIGNEYENPELLI